MSSMLIELLLADHKRIRSLYDELKNECDRDMIHELTCFNLFRTLKALVVAHAKAEEFTLYSLFEHSKAMSRRDLQHFSLEGYEEHDLIDFLMKEMATSEEITPQWRAQLKVLIDLLEHHLQEEEAEFFPKVRQVIEREELIDLAVVYARERDEIFAKKSGIKPAVSIVHDQKLFGH
jgi:hemerythrin-like domain-containing protein